MGFINLLFSVSGRINRAKYWLAVLFWTAAWLVSILFFVIIFAQDIGRFSNADSAEALRLVLSYGAIVVLFIALIIIPMIVSGIFVGIKRLHDRNKSGWWIVLFYLGPVVTESIGQNSGSNTVAFVMSAASFVIAIWALVELGFLRGSIGVNQYGPDPLAPQMASH
jgi:uncharacterized membrane protein YhaH (DUF805 family)